MYHEGYVNDGAMAHGIQQVHQCASSMVAAQGKLAYHGESQVYPGEHWGSWYDDAKHKHICNRTRSYNGGYALSIRMSSYDYNTSYEARMKADAASKCAVVHPQKQKPMGSGKCTGRELQRRPMNLGLFSSEAPPAWSRAVPISDEVRYTIGTTNCHQMLYYYMQMRLYYYHYHLY